MLDTRCDEPPKDLLAIFLFLTMAAIQANVETSRINWLDTGNQYSTLQKLMASALKRSRLLLLLRIALCCFLFSKYHPSIWLGSLGGNKLLTSGYKWYLLEILVK